MPASVNTVDFACIATLSSLAIMAVKSFILWVKDLLGIGRLCVESPLNRINPIYTAGSTNAVY